MLTKNQIKDFATIHHLNEEIVTVSDFKNLKKKKHYLLFLTKTQIQKIEKAAKNKETFDLKISKTQMKKTGKTVVGLNDLLEEVAKQENKKTEKKQNENFETWAFNFSEENKEKIQEALNEESTVTLSLNHPEFRGDGNLEIMLTKKLSREIEKNLYLVTLLHPR